MKSPCCLFVCVSPIITFAFAEIVLDGSLVPTAWRVLGLRIEGLLPAMEVAYEYTEKAAVDSQQDVALQLWGWAWG
jgi:hypothetical protein